MALDKEARTMLFGTPVLSRQIRKCVESRGSMPEQELRSVFPDIGSNLYNQTIRQLQSQGVLVRKDGTVSFCPDAPAIQGGQADRAWRAACLLKSFKLDELCRTAEIKWSYAQKLMARWVSKGLAVKNGPSRSGSPAVWTMVPDKQIPRPVTRGQ